MIEGLLNIIYGLVASLIFLGIGFIYGRYKDRLMNEFLDNMCKVEMDENILSKTEYEKALNEKRHFKDF